MANEITYHSAADSGSTVYAMLENTSGQVWNGAAFEAPASGNWGDYDIPLTEAATSTGIFRASMPGAAAGTYSYVIRLQAGASPAVTDSVLGTTRWFYWSGSAVQSAAEVLLSARSEPAQGAPAVNATALVKLDYLYKNWRNRKVQSSSEFDLYADDAVTVDHKATFSDNGTTATKGEMGTGP